MDPIDTIEIHIVHHIQQIRMLHRMDVIHHVEYKIVYNYKHIQQVVQLGSVLDIDKRIGQHVVELDQLKY
jgi:hypothetical protein